MAGDPRSHDGQSQAAAPGVARDRALWPYVVPGVTLPPFMLAAGIADCLIPNQQSKAFDELIRSVGGSSTFTLLDGASHGDTMFNEQLTTPNLEFLTQALGG